jgi:hypothetical protein
MKTWILFFKPRIIFKDYNLVSMNQEIRVESFDGCLQNTSAVKFAFFHSKTRILFLKPRNIFKIIFVTGRKSPGQV